MINTHTHIISTIGWQTVFDSREDAAQLQQRLSAWSKFRMPLCVSSAFDKICPADQVWAINTLEVDLGSIDYNDLENELSKRLVDILQEKISNLIFYAGMRGSKSIEINGKAAAEFELLQSFLVSGTMTWNHSTYDGSLNELLGKQLKFNRGAIVNLVRRTGTDEQVRKRIAWQFSSSLVHKIIEALEPVAHQEIFQFSGELNSLQQKENIVRSGMPAFKKNMLFWMLTYLLVERGTLFNKEAFIKSSIKQMADHYNVRHKEMLQLIGTAVANITGENKVQSNFLKILQTISAESNGIKITVENNVANADHWMRLETLFNNTSEHRPGTVKKELNELIAALHQEDPARFLSLLQSIDQTAGWWEKFTSDISIASAERLISFFNPAGAVPLMQVIDVLHGAAKSQAMGFDKKMLLAVGIKFARAHHAPGSFDNRACINYFIDCISKLKNTTKTKTCALLALSNLPAALRNDAAIGVYKEIMDTCRLSLSKPGTAALQEHLFHLFAALEHNHSAAQPVDSTVDSLTKMLRRTVHIDPAGLMRFVLAFRRKKVMKKILLTELTTGEINVLLERSGDEKGRALSAFLNRLKNTKKDFDNSILILLAGTLPGLALATMLNYPALSSKKIIQQVLKQLVYKFNADQLAQVLLVLKSLIKKQQQEAIGKSTVDGVDLDYLENRYRIKLPVVQRLILHAGASKEKLLQLLNHQLTVAAFNDLYAGDHGIAGPLLDHVAKDGRRLMAALVKRYHGLINKNAQQEQGVTEKELQELFWSVLLRTCDSNMNADEISRAFALAVTARYDIGNDVLKGKANGASLSNFPSALLKLRTDIDINEDALFKLINQVLLQKKGQLKYKGSAYEPAVLISFALVKYSSRFRDTLLKSCNSKKAIVQLRSAVSFDEFSFWIMSDRENECTAAVKELRLLHCFWESLLPSSTGSMEPKFWDATVEVIREKESPRIHIEKIALTIFDELRSNPAVTPSGAATAISGLNLPANSLLLKSFNSTFPAIPLKNTKTADHPATLAEIERRGLLNQLVAELISSMQLPSWYEPAAQLSSGELMIALLTYYPRESLLIFRQLSLKAKQLEWIIDKAGFPLLIAALKKVERSRQTQLDAFEGYYTAFGKLNIPGITAQTLQAILAKKIIRAWQNNNWRILSAEITWNELLWKLTTVHDISRERFIDAANQQRALLPASLQAAYALLFRKSNTNPPAIVTAGTNFSKRLPVTERNLNSATLKKESIIVKNAGIVLLNNYIPLLLERLGIVQHNRFITPESQADAVHYLQYLVTGLTQTEEYLLPLNKILCGLPLHIPVKSGIEISTEHKRLMDGLIQAAIGYWPVIGNTSLNGFRGNWLVREGQLNESGEHWHLLVDKRSYDVLIGKLPFSFSMIKFPWMSKPLKVTWPY